MCSNYDYLNEKLSNFFEFKWINNNYDQLKILVLALNTLKYCDLVETSVMHGIPGTI